MTNAAEKTLRADPGFISGMKKFDQVKAREYSGQLEQNILVGIGFYNLLEDAVKAKVSTGTLDPQIHSQLIQRGEHAITEFQAAANTMEQLSTLLTQSGLDDVINRHIPAIFKDFDNNGRIQSALSRFRQYGAREESLKCVRDDLAKSDFNVLRIRNAGGTIAGFINSIRIADVQNLVDTIRRQGLPTVMGAGGGGTWGTVVDTIIIIGGIIIIASWFV